MADKKITELADGGAVEATDEFVAARAGGNVKIAGSEMGGGSPFTEPVVIDLTTADGTTKPLQIILPADQLAAVVQVVDDLGNSRFTFSLQGNGNLVLSDADGDHQLTFDVGSGFLAATNAGVATRMGMTGGATFSPTDSGSDAIFLNGTHLVPADGAAMIHMFNVIGDMPDEFYDAGATGDLTINADMTPGSSKVLFKGADTDGNIVSAEIPLT